jgi:hypothetical protein
MTQSPLPEQVKYVPARILQDKFNASQYPIMILQGKLKAKFIGNRHLKHPEERREPEPYCTRGQTIRYSDVNGKWQVEVFQYLRPDGTLGASGKQDPKRMRLDGAIYVLEKR